jgi:phosphoserine phosphatase RsbU/P
MQKILLLLLLATPALAQSALSSSPHGCVWRAGDDLRWAAPNFDDSNWQPASQWIDIATPAPRFWVRCRFDPSELALAVHPKLQVSGDLAWQVFADGRQIGQSGDLQTGAHTAGMVINYDAPEFSKRDGPILVAARMTFTPAVNGEQQVPELALGDAGLQLSEYYSAVYRRVGGQWITWVCYALITSAGLFFFALYWFDRTHRYLLWISLTWLTLAILRINELLVAASVHYPARLEFLLYAIGQSTLIFLVLFFFTLNKRPLPLAYQVIVGVNLAWTLALVAAAMLPLNASMALRWQIEISRWGNIIVVLASLVACAAPLVAFWPLRSLRKAQIPLAAVCFVWMLLDFAYVVVQFPFLHLNLYDMFLKIQPYRSVAIAIVAVAMTLLLVQQIRNANRERAALYGEMQAAREIQRLLVPGAVDPAAGWSLDAAFLPARDVGGDFYLCRVLSKDRLRMLIGDVSGKGAAAAMTAALLIGAAEKRESDSPAEVLRHMNLVLRDSHVGGFATCLCVDLATDGTVVIANAGHLVPYFDGADLTIEPSLPLGIDSGVSYPESKFQFAVGTRLTFLTDGVVEARSRSGELFGFERAASLSTGSAADMARAAETFGQDDDITVLTLTRLGSGEQSTTQFTAPALARA